VIPAVSTVLVGILLDEGAAVFDRRALSADGRYRGVFSLRFDRILGAAEKLVKITAFKARRDARGAEAFVGGYWGREVFPYGPVNERLRGDVGSTCVYWFSL